MQDKKKKYPIMVKHKTQMAPHKRLNNRHTIFCGKLVEKRGRKAVDLRVYATYDCLVALVKIYARCRPAFLLLIAGSERQLKAYI